MADPPPLTVEAAQEELTVQQVILQSLETEWFEGVVEERREARKEIQRLSAFLASARGAGQRASGQGDHEPHRGAHAEDQAASGPSGHPRASSGRMEQRQSPAASHSGSAATATPQRGHDIWSPQFPSLPSRKRELHEPAGDSDARSKSRRTTPTPHQPSDDLFGESPSPTADGDGELDVIDLTRDDIQEDAAFVEEQMRFDKRKEQEKRDRELAIQLSSQTSRPSSPANTSPQTDAFNRIMETQRSNAPPRPGLSARMAGLVEHADPSPASASSSMPGAYHSAWDDPFNSRPAPAGSQPFLPSQRNGSSVPSASSGYGHPGTVGSNGQGGRNMPLTPGQIPRQQYAQSGSANLSGNHPGPGYRPPTLDGFNNPASSMMNPPAVPTLPSQGTLSTIIDRTSRLDYANGLDVFGNPLSERFTEFMQDAVHDPRVSEKELDDLLTNIRPDMDIPEKHRGGTPPGLKRPLYSHQEVALTWMKKMEDGTNKGGILADDMGLGKTISMLALMISRPNKSRPKTNLIVGPLSLMRQWEEEIKTKLKTTHKMSVFIYHNCRASVDDLTKYDVVLTTYGTLAQEYKKLQAFLESNADRNIDYNDPTLAKKCPLLHPTKAVFHRIVLDEAQCIKNKGTKTAMGACMLKGTHRWCLTGTPMMNSVEELYSLVQFLQIKPYCEWDKFRNTFGRLFGKKGDPSNVAMSRLRALLKALMLRRKKNSMLDGKPILVLPEKTEEVVYAELSSDERDFYEQLEKKSQVLFNKYLREGTVGKNYSNILVLLLRMRQACCHPHLNLDVDDVSPVADEDMLELVKDLDPAIVKRIKATESFECPICYDAVQSPSFITPCGHDTCKPCLVRVVDNATANNIQAGNESSGAKCPQCRGPLDQGRCFSFEAFQTIHMPEMIKSEPDDESSGDEDWDNSEYDYDDDDVDGNGDLRDFIVGDSEDEEQDEKPDVKSEEKPAVKAEEDGDDVEKKPRPQSRKRKGKKKQKKNDIKPSMLKTLRQEAYKSRKAYNKYMSYLRMKWMPAAKVTECMRLLKEIQATGEKTIVFSQWTLLLDLLDVAMHHGKFEHKPLRYDGSMSGKERNTAAQRLRDDPDARVMLVSLRAGNAGLNLTSASRVVIMDPFWNPYIEMQAVDRAHRIGQQRHVKVYRVLTRDTVEDRIVELQERKKEIVEAALDESESMKIGRLSVGELKFLFNQSANP